MKAGGSPRLTRLKIHPSCPSISHDFTFLPICNISIFITPTLPSAVDKRSVKMPHAAHNCSLKLLMSGVDPNWIPILTPKQVNKLPARFLDFLYREGEVQNNGDLKCITFTHESCHSRVRRPIQFYTNGELEHLEVQVLDDTGKLAPYEQGLHSLDIACTAAPQTHEQLIVLIHLYRFCLEIGMERFRVYLCERICAYPVYEAEVKVLLKELSQTPNIEQDPDNTLSILHFVDPELLKFLCRRIKFLCCNFVESGLVLSLLRSNITTRDRLLSIISHLDEASAEHMLEKCQVDEETEIEALVNWIVRMHDYSAAPRIPSIGLTEHIGRFPARLESFGVDYKQGDKLTSYTVRTPSRFPRNDLRGKNQSETTTQGQKRARSSTPSVTGTSAATEKSSKQPSDTTVSRPKKLIRPSAKGEYWSATEEAWKQMGHAERSRYHRAGLVCETPAGKVAEEPCDECKKKGIDCVVFVDPKERSSCAWCNANNLTGCSAIKRARKA